MSCLLAIALFNVDAKLGSKVVNVPTPTKSTNFWSMSDLLYACTLKSLDVALYVLGPVYVKNLSCLLFKSIV